MNVAPIKPLISVDDFEKVDIRLGTIEAVEDVPGSDKLVAMTIDFGDSTRRVLAGMKEEREDSREVEGTQALFVVNLAPRKIMGQVSEGMVLDIGYPDGLTPVLAVPERRLPNGARAA